VAGGFQEISAYISEREREVKSFEKFQILQLKTKLSKNIKEFSIGIEYKETCYGC